MNCQRLLSQCIPRLGRRLNGGSAKAQETQLEQVDPLRRTPILVEETMSALAVEPEEVYIDMTFGTGGHSKAILERGAKVIAIDRDPSVKPFAAELKRQFRNRFDFKVAKFTDLRDVLGDLGVKARSIAGVVIECGPSSIQLQAPRGFSVADQNSPLDMRMNQSDDETPTASNLINTLSADSLARIFKAYGQEKYAQRIAEAIQSYRYEMKVIRTIGEYCKLVEAAFVKDHFRKEEIGQRTNLSLKSLLALRYFVNDELNQLNKGIHIVYDVLKGGGTAAIITCTHLEDQIVKRHFQGVEMNASSSSDSIAHRYKNAGGTHEPEELLPKWGTLSKQAVLLPEADIEANPSLKSVKLRAAVKREE